MNWIGIPVLIGAGYFLRKAYQTHHEKKARAQLESFQNAYDPGMDYYAADELYSSITKIRNQFPRRLSAEVQSLCAKIEDTLQQKRPSIDERITHYIAVSQRQASQS